MPIRWLTFTTPEQSGGRLRPGRCMFLRRFGRVLALCLSKSWVTRSKTVVYTTQVPRVLRAPLHQDVSNRGGIQGRSCGNIPRSVEQSRRIHSWSGEACQSAQLFDRPTMPDLSSLHPPRVPYCSYSANPVAPAITIRLTWSAAFR